MSERLGSETIGYLSFNLFGSFSLSFSLFLNKVCFGSQSKSETGKSNSLKKEVSNRQSVDFPVEGMSAMKIILTFVMWQKFNCHKYRLVN